MKNILILAGLATLSACSSPKIDDFNDMSKVEEVISSVTGCEWSVSNRFDRDNVRLCQKQPADDNKYKSFVAAYAFDQDYKEYSFMQHEFVGGVHISKNAMPEDTLKDLMGAFELNEQQIDTFLQGNGDKVITANFEISTKTYLFTGSDGSRPYVKEHMGFVFLVNPTAKVEPVNKELSEAALKEQQEAAEKAVAEKAVLERKEAVKNDLASTLANIDFKFVFLNGINGNQVLGLDYDITEYLTKSDISVFWNANYLSYMTTLNTSQVDNNFYQSTAQKIINDPRKLYWAMPQHDNALLERLRGFRFSSGFEKQKQTQPLVNDLIARIKEDQSTVKASKYFVPMTGSLRLKYDFNEKTFKHASHFWSMQSNIRGANRDLNTTDQTFEWYGTHVNHVYHHGISQLSLPMAADKAQAFAEQYGSQGHNDDYEFNIIAMFKDLGLQQNRDSNLPTRKPKYGFNGADHMHGLSCFVIHKEGEDTFMTIPAGPSKDEAPCALIVQMMKAV